MIISNQKHRLFTRREQYEKQFKSPDALKRKVAVAIAFDGRETEVILAGITDALRYRVTVISDGFYAREVHRFIEKLNGKGYEMLKLRNSWTEHGHKGITTAWRDPHSNQLFEVQFPNRRGSAAGILTHAYYGELRGRNIERAVKLQRNICRLYKITPIDVGIDPNASVRPSDYQYFIWSDRPDLVEATGFGGLLRLEVGAPWDCADGILKTGRWANTDILGRYHLVGTNDAQITPITPERAQSIVQAWRRLGRLETLPQPLPGHVELEYPPRSPGEVAERAEFRRRAHEVQDTILRVWAQVPVPKGAAEITMPQAN
jgi:hypothetical protein